MLQSADDDDKKDEDTKHWIQPAAEDVQRISRSVWRWSLTSLSRLEKNSMTGVTDIKQSWSVGIFAFHQCLIENKENLWSKYFLGFLEDEVMSTYLPVRLSSVRLTPEKEPLSALHRVLKSSQLYRKTGSNINRRRNDYHLKAVNLDKFMLFE